MESKKKDTNELIYNTEIGSDIENKHDKREWGSYYEFRINIYTLLYIK